jgi:nicotinate-nucleotide adenylyltransferase
MVRLAVQDFFPASLPVKVDDIEVKHGSSIPTYFLMKELEKIHPDMNFYFMIGSDLLSTLHIWDEGPKLLEEINFIIFQREVVGRG